MFQALIRRMIRKPVMQLNEGGQFLAKVLRRNHSTHRRPVRTPTTQHEQLGHPVCSESS